MEVTRQKRQRDPMLHWRRTLLPVMFDVAGTECDKKKSARAQAVHGDEEVAVYHLWQMAKSYREVSSMADLAHALARRSSSAASGRSSSGSGHIKPGMGQVGMTRETSPHRHSDSSCGARPLVRAVDQAWIPAAIPSA